MCTAARGRPKGQRSVERVSLSSVCEERPCAGAGWGQVGSQLGLKNGKPEKELQCKDF